MSSRMLARLVSRRFSSSGKILSEEKKVAENICIKGPNPEEKPPTGPSSGVLECLLLIWTMCWALDNRSRAKKRKDVRD